MMCTVDIVGRANSASNCFAVDETNMVLFCIFIFIGIGPALEWEWFFYMLTLML
jgi:hypothetical protein